jgi:hypothetical protein
MFRKILVAAVCPVLIVRRPPPRPPPPTTLKQKVWRDVVAPDLPTGCSEALYIPKLARGGV